MRTKQAAVCLFPSHFNLLLTVGERSAMETLYEQQDQRLVDETELLHKVLVAGIEAMNAAASATRKVAAAESKPSIENYIGLALPEPLRQRIQTFLDMSSFDHEEDAFTMLLDLGLDQAAVLPLAKLKAKHRPGAWSTKLARLSLLAHATRIPR
jgi:hypothetical protein